MAADRRRHRGTDRPVVHPAAGRPARRGDATQVTARGEAVDVEFVEVREVASELATFMVTGGIPTPRLTELREQVSSADG